MLRSRARWIIKEINDELADKLADRLQADRLLARLLAVRGIETEEQANRYLDGGVDDFHDPFLLDGMQTAVDRIHRALRNSEKIRVYGDYDADGVSSTSLMIQLMRRLEAQFDYYIPHRANEGYGLNENALLHAKKNGISLIITVDTGISAVKEASYAAELGIDMIITDHHEPPAVLPQAYAIINPKKPGCPYPFKQLAGVGVAFKLAHALTGGIPEELLEYAAIGTVADLMPLTDENRVIVHLGIERMRASTLPGIKALTGVAGINSRELNAGHIAFAFAPRINASGRLDSADDAVKLLTTASEQDAEHLAFDLDQLNKERQRIVEDMSKQALQQVEDTGCRNDRAVVLMEDDWNVGVIGIVASKVLEKLYRPTIILSHNPETGLCKGSARSISGFDLYGALTECADLLEHYGGHQAAAGMTLRIGNVTAFRERLNEIAGRQLRDEDLVPQYTADLQCGLDDLSLDLIRQIERLAPFGMGNPSPKIIVPGLKVLDKRTIGKEQQHLKMVLSDKNGTGGGSIEAVGFGLGGLLPYISSSASMDVLGELSVNEWNGTRKPQLVIKDMRIPQIQVFDWRGVKDTPAKLLQRLGDRRADESGQYGPAFVIFSQSSYKAYGLHAVNELCSLWRIDDSGQAVPLNDMARKSAFAETAEIIFYTMPDRLQLLDAALDQAERAERLYAVFADADPHAGAVGAPPSRDSFKSAYSSFMQLGSWDARDPRMMQSLVKRTGLSAGLIHFMIKVFQELEFIEKDGEMFRCVRNPHKRELSDSPAYQAVMGRGDMEQILIYSTSQDLAAWMTEGRKTAMQVDKNVKEE